MSANNPKERPRFTIENNVLKGEAEAEAEAAPGCTSRVSFGQIVFDSLKSNPRSIAQVDPITENQDSFENLLTRSIKCAVWMRKRGVKPGHVVGVATYNHLDSCVPCIAALFIGAIFNPWDHAANEETVRHFLNLSGAKILFADEGSSAGVILEAAKMEKLYPEVVVFGDRATAGGIPFSRVLADDAPSEIEDFRCTGITDTRQTAVILYSSGTTGLPKGVQLSHDSLIRSIETCKTRLADGQIPIWFSTLSWISGVLLTFQAITSRIQRIVCPSFDEEMACKLIQKYKVTWLFLGTSMANRLVKSGYLDKYDVSSLKMLLIGGATLKRESQEEIRKYLPGVDVLQAYGMTELGGIVSCQAPDSPDGSVGLVCANTEVKVVDLDTEKVLGPNEQGEFHVRTATVMTGYYKNPEATMRTIDEQGWLHTGDLGYFDENGELFIVDRIKELIKYRGYHVTPSLIEDLLQSHPAVREAAVVPMPHPTDDEHPIAFVSRVPGENELTAQELIDLVANSLMDSHKLRGGVKFLDNLPHNASGKINRKALREVVKSLTAAS